MWNRLWDWDSDEKPVLIILIRIIKHTKVVRMKQTKEKDFIIHINEMKPDKHEANGNKFLNQ